MWSSLRSPSLLLCPLVLLLLCSSSLSAPAHCRACTKNCPGAVPQNSTDPSDLLEDLQAIHGNRTKRSSDIQVAPCQAFPIEIVLIPLAIAVIPLALCALLFCTCCCGPKESRAKKPDNMMETVRKYSHISHISQIGKPRETSEDMELEWRDGYVQRKDSTMTKFSTTVAYIEPARRQSIWSIGGGSAPPSEPTSPVRKTPSTDSSKKTRFSDMVTVRDLPT